MSPRRIVQACHSEVVHSSAATSGCCAGRFGNGYQEAVPLAGWRRLPPASSRCGPVSLGRRRPSECVRRSLVGATVRTARLDKTAGEPGYPAACLRIRAMAAVPAAQQLAMRT